MADVVYRSRIRIERVRGPLRRAYLPVLENPIEFGVHDEVADHYGVARGSEVERPTTLDFVVAAAGGWLTGTFGGALEARQIQASGGRLTSEAVGEIEVEDGVLVIKRIHVAYALMLDPEADHEAVQRAFDHHMPRCPVYRSIQDAIDVTTSLELTAAPA